MIKRGRYQRQNKFFAAVVGLAFLVLLLLILNAISTSAEEGTDSGSDSQIPQDNQVSPISAADGIFIDDLNEASSSEETAADDTQPLENPSSDIQADIPVIEGEPEPCLENEVCISLPDDEQNEGDEPGMFFAQEDNSTENQTEQEQFILDILDSPRTITDENQSLSWALNTTYSHVESIECTLEIANSTTSQYFDEPEFQYQITILLNELTSHNNDSYSWSITCAETSNKTNSDGESGSFEIRIPASVENETINVTTNISFSVNPQRARVNQTIQFTVEFNSNINQTVYYVLDYNDGNFSNIPSRTLSELQETFDHQYVSSRNYTPELTFVIVSQNNNLTKYTKSVEIWQNTTHEDTSDPEINLLEPDDDSEIDQDTINFSYSVEDESPITNCTLTLYYYNQSGLIGAKVYENVKKNLPNSTQVNLTLSDFDDGDYSWDVGCFDSMDNYQEESEEFTVDKTGEEDSEESNQRVLFSSQDSVNENYERKADVENLLSQINSFLEKYEQYGIDEKEAIAELNLLEETNFYKKKLLQIKLDLQTEVDKMSDEQKRDQRRQEIFTALDEMSEKIVSDVKVSKKYEYSKNAIDADLDELVSNYANASNLVLDKKTRDSFKNEIRKIQNQITVQAKVMALEMKSGDRTKRGLLVIKKIETKNSTLSSFVEIIPKEIEKNASNILWINKNQIILEDPIVEIDQEDLKENKLIYFVENAAEPESIEKTDTLAISKSFSRDADIRIISGFAILEDMLPNKSFVYGAWAVLFCLLGIFVYGTVRKQIRKKIVRKPENRNSFVALKLAKRAIKQKQIDKAREEYTKIKSDYGQLTPEGKKLMYREIEKLKEEIDRKEFSKLLKEYRQAKKENRPSEAALIYAKLKTAYPLLPEKHKRKAYERLKEIEEKKIW